MMKDRLKRGVAAAAFQWVLWSPWRLGLVLGLLFLLWLTTQTLTPSAEPGPSSPPAPTATVDTSRLPEGWETWPAVAAR